MTELNEYFKSIIDADDAQIVVCDTRHTIIYMNPAAVAVYSKRGGDRLVGRSIFDCHNERSVELIKRVADWFSQSAKNNRGRTFYSEKQNKDVYMIALRDDSGALVGYYEKHEFRAKDDTPFYDMSGE